MKTHILLSIATLLVACTTDQQPPTLEQRGPDPCKLCCGYMCKIAKIINNDFNAGAPYPDDAAYAQQAWVVLGEIAAEINENNHGCKCDTVPVIPAPPGICPDTLQ